MHLGEGEFGASIHFGPTPAPATELGGGDGTLGAFIWPVYVGLTTRHPTTDSLARPDGEPTFSPFYERGQIHWQLEDDVIIGKATIHAPAMEYTHLIYLYGPADMPMMMGHRQIEQPLRLAAPAVIPVYPIHEGDWLPQSNGAVIR